MDDRNMNVESASDSLMEMEDTLGRNSDSYKKVGSGILLGRKQNLWAQDTDI